MSGDHRAARAPRRRPGGSGHGSDCLVGSHAGLEIRFFFDPKTVDLVAIEMYSNDEQDPCELELTDFGPLAGRRLPRSWIIRHGDREFVRWKVDQWQFDQPSHSAATEEK